MKSENYLKNAEMAMEDDYGMIDGIINNGKDVRIRGTSFGVGAVKGKARAGCFP